MANFMGDLASSYQAKNLLSATSTGVTTDSHLTSTGIEIPNAVSGVATAFLTVGNIAGTGTPTANVKLQESTNNSTWTDIDGAVFNAVSTSNSNQLLAFKPNEKYIRSTGTVSGTSPVLELAVSVIYPLTSAPVNFGGFSLASAAGNAE